jgi:beta-glucanase (GH16 family)
MISLPASILWIATLASGPLVACDSSSADGESNDSQVGQLPGYELVWQDEFDEDGLPDPDRWGYDVGDHGWGNNELQDYMRDDPQSARVEDGQLIITAYAVPNEEPTAYRSARIKTKNKGDWRYARVDVRARLPRGRGTWPAIWMLPTDWVYGGWPRSGEIDIMEHVGYDQNVVHGTVHTEAFNHTMGTQRGSQVTIPGASTEFNVYSIEWSDRWIDFSVNGSRYYTFRNTGNGPAEWPFDQRFHLIMNIAVGGNWGGAQGVDPTVFPQEMRVDYVRVYKPKD